ncbi:hypothetical protein FRB97_002213 [Tulasnella sp. 331]|nr:hypothetical protein FRB97_002213 [Tulasnella sp. 331]
MQTLLHRRTKNRNGTVLRKIKSIGSKATSLLKSAPKEVANLTHAARGSTNSTRIPKTSLILNKARRLDHHDRSDSVQPVTLLPTPKPPVKAVNYLGHLPQHDLVRGLVDHGICTQSAGDAFLAKSEVSVNTFEPALNLDDKDPDEDKLFSTIDESHLSLETTYDDIRNLICRGALPGAARNAYLFQAPPISPGFNDTSLQTSSDKISYSLDPEPAPLYPLVDDLVAIPAVSSLLSATQPPPPSFRLTNQQSRFVEHFNLDAPFENNPIAESLGSQPEAQQTARLHHTPQKCLGKQTREEVLVGLISHDLISKAAGKPHFPHTRTLADSSPAHSSSKTFHVFNSHPFTSQIPTLCSLRNADLVDSLGVPALPSPTPVDHPTPWLNVAEYLRNQTMEQMVGELIHHGIVCRTARHIYPGLQLATSHRYPGLLTRRSPVASSKSSFFFQSEPAKDIDSHERSGGSASLTSPHTPVSAVLPEVKIRFFEDFRIDADEDVSPIPTATHDEAYKVSRRSPPRTLRASTLILEKLPRKSEGHQPEGRNEALRVPAVRTMLMDPTSLAKRETIYIA